MKWVVLSVLVTAFVALGLVSAFSNPRQADAEAMVTRYYVTTEVRTFEDDALFIRPYLVGQLASGEDWASVFHEAPFYILRVTAPASRHNTLFPSAASLIGNTKADVHRSLRTRVDVGSVRVLVDQTWRQLQERGCTVPSDPVELVEFGGVHCP